MSNKPTLETRVWREIHDIFISRGGQESSWPPQVMTGVVAARLAHAAGNVDIKDVTQVIRDTKCVGSLALKNGKFQITFNQTGS